MLQRLHDERAALVVVFALLQLRRRRERGHPAAGFAPRLRVVRAAGVPGRDRGLDAAGAGVDLGRRDVGWVDGHRLLVPGFFCRRGGVDSFF